MTISFIPQMSLRSYLVGLLAIYGFGLLGGLLSTRCNASPYVGLAAGFGVGIVAMTMLWRRDRRLESDTGSSSSHME